MREITGSKNKKVCEVYISPYCQQGPVWPNFKKFGIRGQVTDVITCVKFLVNRFRGY